MGWSGSPSLRPANRWSGSSDLLRILIKVVREMSPRARRTVVRLTGLVLESRGCEQTTAAGAASANEERGNSNDVSSALSLASLVAACPPRDDEVL